MYCFAFTFFAIINFYEGLASHSSVTAKMSKSNKARGIERKITVIAKNATEAWEKLQNPNCFGGGPVTDPQGKLISLDITAFGHLAKFFEEPDVQARLREAIRKNNLEFSGYDEGAAVAIKKSVESGPPPPPIPIFLMKSYNIQSYLSTLIRYYLTCT